MVMIREKYKGMGFLNTLVTSYFLSYVVVPWMFIFLFSLPLFIVFSFLYMT